MTITALGSIGDAASGTSGTSLVITTTAAAAVGNLVLLVVGKDNTSTGDSVTNEVTTVEDSGGNGWWKIAEYCNGQGGAAAGAVVSVWACLVGAQIASAGTITITMDTTTAKAAGAYKYSLSQGYTVIQAGTTQNDAADAADYTSLSVSGLPSAQYLFFRAAGGESSAQSQNTTSWTNIVSKAQGASMFAYAEHHITTATSDTSNPGGSSPACDHASVMFALQEYLVPSALFSGAPL